MTRIILVGCNGRMGQIISALVSEDKESEIVMGVDIKNDISPGYPVCTSIGECSGEADVIVDFSLPENTDALLDFIEEKQIPAVICTTACPKPR